MYELHKGSRAQVLSTMFLMYFGFLAWVFISTQTCWFSLFILDVLY